MDTGRQSRLARRQWPDAHRRGSGRSSRIDGNSPVESAPNTIRRRMFDSGPIRAECRCCRRTRALWCGRSRQRLRDRTLPPRISDIATV